MSTVSSISSTPNPYQTTSQTGFAQSLADFNSIGSALQTGNLASAQSALATFQQDLPGNSQTSGNQPFGKNTQANTDFQNLSSALNSGDVAGAQKAFASLQKDLQGTSKTHRHHGHHGGGSEATQPAAPTMDTSDSSDSASSGTTGSLLNTTA